MDGCPPNAYHGFRIKVKFPTTHPNEELTHSFYNITLLNRTAARQR
jgi:hypothetical protein